jgi:hypothetical protein
MSPRISQKYSPRVHIKGPYYSKVTKKRVPAVTTVLGKRAKPALIHWSWKLGTEGIDYRKHRDELADVGKAVHSRIVDYLSGQDMGFTGLTEWQVKKAENSWLSFLAWERSHDLEPIEMELSLVSELYLYGGRFDFYGNVDKILTLVDFKTGKYVYDDHWIQAGGYNQLIIEDEEFGLQIPEKFMIVNVPRAESERFQEDTKVDLSLEWQAFEGYLMAYKAEKLMGLR